MADQASAASVPVLTTAGDWESLIRGECKSELEAQLPALLRSRRWFGAKGRQILSTKIEASVPVPHEGGTSYVSLIRVEYADGPADLYVLPFSYTGDSAAQDVLSDGSAFARLKTADRDAVLFDAARDASFTRALVKMIADEKESGRDDTVLQGVRTSAFEQFGGDPQSFDPRVMRAEQSNTSIVFGDRLILKLFRRLQPGVNPDFEIGRFLTEHGFRNTPATAGALQLSGPDMQPTTAAILQAFVANRGDAWKYTLESLDQMLRRAVTTKLQSRDRAAASLFELMSQFPPSELSELAGEYLESARLLGKRTAEMHLALAQGSDDAFAPEPFSREYQQSLAQGMESLASSSLRLLRIHLERLPEGARRSAEELLQHEREVLDQLRAVAEMKIDAIRIRIHGDYHLGQVLFTGTDFMIIDFEGEPMRSIEERRQKKSPLQDVAGMLRSFDYAAYSATASQVSSGAENEGESLIDEWRRWTSAAFLASYLQSCGHAEFLPRDRAQLEMLLNAFLLEKAAYELAYEINNRPAWVGIPIAGILQILEQRRTRERLSRTA